MASERGCRSADDPDAPNNRSNYEIARSRRVHRRNIPRFVSSVFRTSSPDRTLSPCPAHCPGDLGARPFRRIEFLRIVLDRLPRPVNISSPKFRRAPYLPDASRGAAPRPPTDAHPFPPRDIVRSELILSSAKSPPARHAVAADRLPRPSHLLGPPHLLLRELGPAYGLARVHPRAVTPRLFREIQLVPDQGLRRL